MGPIHHSEGGARVLALGYWPWLSTFPKTLEEQDEDSDSRKATAQNSDLGAGVPEKMSAAIPEIRLGTSGNLAQVKSNNVNDINIQKWGKQT